LAGVSIATVSKVLNGRRDVAPHTRIRVQELLHQHDYIAPVLRRAEVPQRHTVELQFQGEFRSYAAEALEGIMDAAIDLGVSVAISKPDHGPHWARDLVLAGRRALIAVNTVYTAAHLKALERAGLPVVVLDPQHLPHIGVTSVGATNFAGGQAATQHLLALGHRRIAYLGGPIVAACNQARMHGYRAAMEAEKLPIPRGYIRPGEFAYQAGLRGAAALLDLAEPPTAIFAGNDEIPLGVLESCPEVIDLCLEVARIGLQASLSDAGVGAQMGRAAAAGPYQTSASIWRGSATPRSAQRSFSAPIRRGNAPGNFTTRRRRRSWSSLGRA